jgi:hypothetical protein
MKLSYTRDSAYSTKKGPADNVVEVFKKYTEAYELLYRKHFLSPSMAVH